MTLPTGPLTYEEYMQTPETKERHEVVDGEIVMLPRPTLRHQTILKQLFKPVDDFVIKHGLGEVLFAPLDVLVQRQPLRVRQPDLLFVSNGRLSILKQIVEGGPDLVVDILSPGYIRADMSEKLADYHRLGVRECWVVSPEASSVEVLVLSQGNWQRLEIYGLGDQVQSNVLSELSVPVTEIFG